MHLRITSLSELNRRIWIGTGTGIIVSIPLNEGIFIIWHHNSLLSRCTQTINFVRKWKEDKKWSAQLERKNTGQSCSCPWFFDICWREQRRWCPNDRYNHWNYSILQFNSGAAIVSWTQGRCAIFVTRFIWYILISRFS